MSIFQYYIDWEQPSHQDTFSLPWQHFKSGSTDPRKAAEELITKLHRTLDLADEHDFVFVVIRDDSNKDPKVYKCGVYLEPHPFSEEVGIC